jgi:transposase-like protein
MPGEGRSFRRKTARFWEIWPLPPLVEEQRDVLYVDGIYLGRKACVLICCDEKHVLGWYLCRYEYARAWSTLMSRIAEPKMVVSDGGSGFAKALKKTLPHAKHQRCIFHVFCQVRRYTTSRPKTSAGLELYVLAKDLLHLE